MKRPPALKLVKQEAQTVLNVMGQHCGTSTACLCQLRRLFFVYSRRDKEENNISSYSVPASAIVLTKSQLDISSSYPLVPEL